MPGEAGTMQSAETKGAAAASDGETLAEGFARFLAGLTTADLPAAAKAVALRDLVDAAGLCLAARNETYVQPVLAGWDSEGTCTALGHDRALDSAGRALVTGVAQLRRATRWEKVCVYGYVQVVAVSVKKKK